MTRQKTAHLLNALRKCSIVLTTVQAERLGASCGASWSSSPHHVAIVTGHRRANLWNLIDLKVIRKCPDLGNRWARRLNSRPLSSVCTT
jgi:hypothetical protein